MTGASEPSGLGGYSPAVPGNSSHDSIPQGFTGRAMARPSPAANLEFSVSEYSLVALKFASSLWSHVSCFLKDF